MEYASILISWGFNAFIVDVVLNNFIENDVLSYLASLLVVGLFAGLFLTPPGTLLLRIQNGLREPSRMEHQRVDPILILFIKGQKEKVPIYPMTFAGSRWKTINQTRLPLDGIRLPLLPAY